MACLVAVQSFQAAHANISARAEGRRFRSEGKISSVQQGPLLNGGTHGYVDILENFTGRDSLRPVRGFHKIVAFLSAMFTSERIPELQGTGELPGSNQKSRPIDLPFVFYFPHLFHPWGREYHWDWLSVKTQFSLAGFSVKVKPNLRVIRDAVNPKLLCNSKICQHRFLGAPGDWKMREDSPLER